MSKLGKLKKMIILETILVSILAVGIGVRCSVWQEKALDEGTVNTSTLSAEKGFIKWVDFNVSYEALCAAFDWAVKTYDTEHPVGFVELLAYAAAKTGGEFESKALKILNKAAGELAEGEVTLEELTEDMKYYTYYREAYGAVLDGMVGEFEEEYINEDGEKCFREVYGLKAFFPLAKGFDYTHYDDFGAGRSYGYQRKHLGHDMMGQIGTPIRIKCRM